MASLDIGIDLGTCNIIANDSTRSIVLREPSIVALDKRSGKVLEIGAKVYRMIGRTPEYIEVIRPLTDGVISDYQMTQVLIRHFLRQICNTQLIRPRVTLCVPSVITSVESQAVVDATVTAGARKVYLIEEPVAAAIGAGMDISKAEGNMIIDVGGGSCDIAVLSLNGIVCKTSIRVAGQAFDQALVKYMRAQYNLLIGERSAEELKIAVGSVFEGCEDAVADVKGRDLISGLPKKVPVRRSETLIAFREPIEQILRETVGVLEKTPPELVGDIRTNGIVLTGGGVKMTGFAQRIEQAIHVPTRVADMPEECVAIGTARSFTYLDKLYDGFVSTSTHTH